MLCRLIFIFIFVTSFLSLGRAFDFAETSYNLINGECPKAAPKSNYEKYSGYRLGNTCQDRVTLLRTQSGALADNAFLASLAAERSSRLACSESQISNLQKNPEDEKKLVDDIAAKLIQVGTLERNLQTLQPAIASDAKARKEYYATQREILEITSTISYAEVGPMSFLIRNYASQTDQYPSSGTQDWFVKQMKSDITQALNSTKSKIRDERTVLNAGVNSMGESLSDNVRESLAQDTDLIESFRKDHPSIESSLKPIACSVDAKYGKGAKYRDDAIMIATTVGTLAVGGASFAAAKMMATVTDAAAAGSITARTASLLRFFAMAAENGETAMMAYNFNQAVKKCGNLTLGAASPGAKSGKTCENILSTIADNNCYLEAGLTAFGAVGKLAKVVKTASGATLKMLVKADQVADTSTAAKYSQKLAKTDELLAKSGLTREDLAAEKSTALRGSALNQERSIVSQNGALKDADRAKKIKQDFQNLSDDQIACIVNDVHSIGAGNTVFKYSEKEIFQKARTLKSKCGVSDVADIEALIRLGYAGKVPVGTTEDLTREEGEFAKLLRAKSARVEKTADEIQQGYFQLEKDFASTTDPMQKALIQEKMRVVEQEYAQKLLEEQPDFLQKARQGEIKLREYDEADRVKSTVILPTEARKDQLIAQGATRFQAEIAEMKPGQLVGYNSNSFGVGFGEIKGVDPENANNLLIKITTKAGDTKTISVAQTDLAVTAKEQGRLAANLPPEPGAFKKLLDQKETPEQFAAKAVANFAKQVTRTPQDIRLSEIDNEIHQIEFEGNPLLSERYHQLLAERNRITTLSIDDKRVLEAVRLIDTSNVKGEKEYADLLTRAKAIVANTDSKHLTVSEELLVKTDIARIEKELAAAPQKLASSRASQLLKLNGTSTFGRVNNYPSRDAFNRMNELTHAAQYKDYKAMETLFSEDPRHLSTENLTWLRGAGQSILGQLEKYPDTPEAQYFLQRLRAYVDVMRAN